MIRTLKTKRRTVSFNDTPELRDMVFEKLVSYFQKYDAFYGEDVAQSDSPQVGAIDLMTELADDFKFEEDD